jgi:hypothetical protein
MRGRVGNGLLLMALLATFGLNAGLAAADTPGTTVTVTPNINLAVTQNVSVTGTGGFGVAQPGTIRQTIMIGGVEQFGVIIANFTTNSSGAFSPVTVTVRRTFTTISNTQVTCSASQPCAILAATDQTEQFAHAPITFRAAPPPPTINVCAPIRSAQATANAQINAIIAGLPANIPPAQRAAIIAQFEAVRAAANASFAVALARAGCTAVP